METQQKKCNFGPCKKNTQPSRVPQRGASPCPPGSGLRAAGRLSVSAGLRAAGRLYVSAGLGAMLLGVSGSCDDSEVTSLPDEVPMEPDSEKETCGGTTAVSWVRGDE